MLQLTLCGGCGCGCIFICCGGDCVWQWLYVMVVALYGGIGSICMVVVLLYVQYMCMVHMVVVNKGTT